LQRGKKLLCRQGPFEWEHLYGSREGFEGLIAMGPEEKKMRAKQNSSARGGRLGRDDDSKRM